METRELVLSWGCLNNFTPMFCMASLPAPPLRFFSYTVGLQTQGVSALTSVLRTELKPRNSSSPEVAEAGIGTGEIPRTKNKPTNGARAMLQN